MGSVAVTHSKTLVAPDSGVEDKVYGVDYVASNSHTVVLSLTSSDVGLGSVANVDTTNAANISSGILPTARLGTSGSGSTFALATSPTLTTPILGSYTFATLPSAASNSGAAARVTDVGPARAGSIWLSNGTIWKPSGGRVTLGTLLSRFNRPATQSNVVAFQVLLPAAFLSVLDRIRIYSSFSKAGTTTTGTLGLYVGTVGTVGGDTVITGTGGATLSAANRSVGRIDDLVVQSATSIVKAGMGSNINASYSAAGGSGYSAATTGLPNVSNALYISVAILPGATDDVALEDCVMEYICT